MTISGFLMVLQVSSRRTSRKVQAGKSRFRFAIVLLKF